MTQMTKAVVLAGALVLAGVSSLSAQAPNEPARLFVSVGGGLQLAEQTTGESGSFSLYGETGTFSASRKVGTGPFFDAAVGMHVAGKISAAVAVSRYIGSDDVAFDVEVPHPLLFDTHRRAALDVKDYSQIETVVHLQAIYQLLSRRKYDASVFVGPSIFFVKQDTVTSVTAAETGSPYTAVNLSATFGDAKKTAIGAHVGVDFNYHLKGALSVGAFARYSRASAKLTPEGNDSRTVNVGGPQVGLCLRYRF